MLQQCLQFADTNYKEKPLETVLRLQHGAKSDKWLKLLFQASQYADVTYEPEYLAKLLKKSAKNRRPDHCREVIENYMKQHDIKLPTKSKKKK